ncbi:MAG: metallophosphoesterase [Nitrospirae bacterium]|nr:metallophosphoesterase [Nitrospirota bacterium]
MFFRLSSFFIRILIGSFAVHFLLYLTVIRFFPVGPRVKVLLPPALVILSVSFVTSLILVRFYENFFTEVYYALSALCLGLLINLIFAMTLCWFVFLLVKMTSLKINMTYAASFLFLASFLFAVYGIWNAFNPRITHIEVKIKNLPERWRNKIVVQLSDVHLGVIHRAGYFRSVVRKVNSLHPEAVFITGDLFDGVDGALTTFTGPLDEFDTRERIFYVTGNHENYMGIERALSTLKQTRIKILDDEVAQMDGLQIVGVSYPRPGNEGDIRNIISSRKNFVRGMPSILLYHTPTSIERAGGTSSEQMKRTYWSPDLNFSAAKELGINLQLSGHTHQGQLFPFTYVAKRIYQGYEYGLHKDGDFSIYTTSGVGTWGPPMRTGTTPEIVVITLK